MRFCASIATATLATALFASVATLQAFDDAKYPDLSGQWTAVRLGVRGQPAMMTLYQAMEIIVLPETTYIRIDHTHESFRRIYTDGRDWPKVEVQPTFVGYSIGKWIDEDGDGKYDVLEVETRHLKGPRPLDPAGMPTHVDNKSIVKERFFQQKDAPDRLFNEITLID